MPPARFATFLQSLLAYDANLKGHAGKRVDLAVLYDDADPSSRAEGTALADALKTLELTRIVDLPVATSRIAVTDARALEVAVAARGIDVFVVTSGLVNHLAAIEQVSRKAKVVTVATTSAPVRAGLSIAVYLANGKSKILVNLAASRAEAAPLSSELLGLSEVIP